MSSKSVSYDTFFCVFKTSLYIYFIFEYYLFFTLNSMSGWPKKLSQNTKQVIKNIVDVDKDQHQDVEDLISSLESNTDNLNKELQQYLQKRINYISWDFSWEVEWVSYFDEVYEYLMNNVSEETQSYIDTANNQELALLFVLMKKLWYINTLDNMDFLQKWLSNWDDIQELSLSPTGKLIAAVLKLQKESEYYTSDIDGLPGEDTLNALLCEVWILDCSDNDVPRPWPVDAYVREMPIDGTYVEKPPLGIVEVPWLRDGELLWMSEDMVKKEITRGTDRLKKNLSAECDYCTYVSETIERWLWEGNDLHDTRLADAYIDTVFSKSDNDLQKWYRLTKLTDKSLQAKYFLEYLYSSNRLLVVNATLLQHIIWNISKDRTFEEMLTLGKMMKKKILSTEERVSFAWNEQIQRYQHLQETPAPISFLEDKLENSTRVKLFMMLQHTYKIWSIHRLRSYFLQSILWKMPLHSTDNNLSDLEALTRSDSITIDDQGEAFSLLDRPQDETLLKIQGVKLLDSINEDPKPMNEFLKEYAHEMPLYKEYSQKSIAGVFWQDRVNIPAPRPWEKLGISIADTPAGIIDQDPQKMLGLLAMMKTFDMQKQYPETTPENIWGSLLLLQLEWLMDTHGEEFINSIKEHGNNQQREIVGNMESRMRHLAKYMLEEDATGVEKAGMSTVKLISYIILGLIIIFLWKKLQIFTLLGWLAWLFGAGDKEKRIIDPDIQLSLTKKLGLLSEDIEIVLDGAEYDIEFDDVYLWFDNIDQERLFEIWQKYDDLWPIYVHLTDKNTDVDRADGRTDKSLKWNDKLEVLIKSIAGGQIPAALHDVLMEKRMNVVKRLAKDGLLTGWGVKNINFAKEMKSSTFIFMYNGENIWKTIETLDPKNKKDRVILERVKNLGKSVKTMHIQNGKNETQDTTGAL